MYSICFCLCVFLRYGLIQLYSVIFCPQSWFDSWELYSIILCPLTWFDTWGLYSISLFCVHWHGLIPEDYTVLFCFVSPRMVWYLKIIQYYFVLGPLTCPDSWGLCGIIMFCLCLQACFDAHVVDMEEFSTDPHTVAGGLSANSLLCILSANSVLCLLTLYFVF